MNGSLSFKRTTEQTTEGMLLGPERDSNCYTRGSLRCSRHNLTRGLVSSVVQGTLEDQYNKYYILIRAATLLREGGDWSRGVVG